MNITEAILNATEKSTVSKKLLSFNLISLRIAKPGIIDKKKKTAASLRRGMSSEIAIFAKKVEIGIIIRVFLNIDHPCKIP
jgi:hypothetical protein